MKLISLFLNMFGGLSLGIIFHELYHSSKGVVDRVCYEAGTDRIAFVSTTSQTGEVIPYIITALIFILVMIFSIYYYSRS